MKEFWIYTGMRALLFIASFGVIAGVWLLVADEAPLLLVLILALLASGVGSYFLLNQPREALARRVQGRAERMSTRFEEMKAKEDQD